MSVGPSVGRSVRRLPLCSGVPLSNSGRFWTALRDSWQLSSDSEWLRVTLGNSGWLWVTLGTHLLVDSRPCSHSNKVLLHCEEEEKLKSSRHKRLFEPQSFSHASLRPLRHLNVPFDLLLLASPSFWTMIKFCWLNFFFLIVDADINGNN